MMPTLELKSWLDKNGRRKYVSKYTVHVHHELRLYRVVGFRATPEGKAMSRELGTNIRRILEARSSGTLPPRLRAYIEGLPASIRESLAERGIIDRTLEGKTLQQHAADFREALTQKGDTKDHVNSTVNAVTKASKACGFTMLGEVRQAQLRDYLAGLRDPKPRRDSHGKALENAAGEVLTRAGISARRHNAIVTAWGTFFHWALRERRCHDNPLLGLPRLNERTDRRHQRRALDLSEVLALLAAAEAGPELHGMTGQERSLIYRTAAETGLRQNELRTLTRSCLDLEGQNITVQAGYSKHRREDVVPMRAELAETLRGWVANKAPATRVFNLPNRTKTIRAFRVDLAAAGIAPVDPEGRHVDFHATRHTFVSSLAAGGVHPKTAQNLARHSTIDLTMNVYTHTLGGAEALALRSLPNYQPAPPAKNQTA